MIDSQKAVEEWQHRHSHAVAVERVRPRRKRKVRRPAHVARGIWARGSRRTIKKSIHEARLAVAFVADADVVVE